MKDNWSLLVTHAGDPPQENSRAEQEMRPRLATLKQKWANRNPDLEVSVVNREGGLIYMGRYFEGVVIRINDQNDHVTFLTTEMATQFGKWLAGEKGEGDQVEIPKDTTYPVGAGQCDDCGGRGCGTCSDKGWLPPGHPKIRKCEAGCGVSIPPGHIAAYCSNQCAANDA